MNRRRTGTPKPPQVSAEADGRKAQALEDGADGVGGLNGREDSHTSAAAGGCERVSQENAGEQLSPRLSLDVGLRRICVAVRSFNRRPRADVAARLCNS